MIGKRLNVGSLLLSFLVDGSDHLRKFFLVDELWIGAMVFEQLGDLGEGELGHFVLQLVEAGLVQGVRLVARVLVLRENVAPQLLILFHEL